MRVVCIKDFKSSSLQYELTYVKFTNVSLNQIGL